MFIFLTTISRFQDFIQNVMWKCPWSQSVMLGRFNHVFVVMHNGLELLFDGVGDLGGEPDV
jgi:hypothetical protein